jgi:hypothetical protein
MKGRMTYWQRIGAVLSIVLALIVTVPPGGARASSNANPGVISIDDAPYGPLSAAWWQYVYSLPQSNSPFFDPTGAHCAVGQAGSKVFFLVGIAPTATQSCTVPAGTTLFFPVVNFEGDNVCPVNSPPLTVAQLRQLAAGLMDDAATSVHASIDGVAVQHVSSYRVTSPVFSVTVPAAANLCNAFGGTASGITFRPVVGDGYYLLLAPLPPGQHTIVFGGAVPSVGFSLEDTYNLTVSG